MQGCHTNSRGGEHQFCHGKTMTNAGKSQESSVVGYNEMKCLGNGLVVMVPAYNRSKFHPIILLLLHVRGPNWA